MLPSPYSVPCNHETLPLLQTLLSQYNKSVTTQRAYKPAGPITHYGEPSLEPLAGICLWLGAPLLFSGKDPETSPKPKWPLGSTELWVPPVPCLLTWQCQAFGA